MVACGFWVCRVVVVDMNPSYSSTTGVSNLTPYKLPPFFTSRSAVKLFGFGSQRKAHLRRRLKLVVSAELSKPFSLSFGLDSQAFRSHDLSQLPWIGPVPGDIAEVEAYCRIFRAAEWLHCALMDTLCNPLTGECSVSYDFTSEEKPLLEDKIVSVLGCMLSLLNKGREDVLSGRSSIMSSFRVADVSAMEDKLPPLAIFRGEMKRCCESLHFALENYLTPDDDRSFDVWRKLQRLKNVCYDSGFPRGDDYPSHMLFANWNPVYLSTSKEDTESKEAAFWSGGQVTEEGLKWLIDKGYKTIVDLRAENVKDIFYEAVVHDAVLSGKVELVKFPVEARTAPSMEQVEKFASLVSDSSKKPIYLHSKEGAWRTSAMVSRWRQYMARSALQLVSNQPIVPNEILSRDPDGREELHVLSDVRESKSLKDETESLQQSSDIINSSNGVFHEQASRVFDNKEESSNGAYNSHSSQERIENLPVLGETYIGTRQRSKTNGTGSASRLVETGGSNGSLSHSNVSPKAQSSAAANGALKNDDSCVSVGSTVNGFYKGERCSMTGSDGSSFVNNKLNKDATSTTVREDQKSHDKASIVSGDDVLGQIEGNMCASTTGVVRVQSRKKAEMFLVRTDGFSCTREKVTESSLAFTHPSTQQQMLMWKSTPKTVLLLKKLGQALMEEAKEVPFLDPDI
ncbi:NAD kinase 2, chloroplastic [Vitis vinifera]|uniref:NAD kinase 2, chloroplastic n=1 Tax=Vitis vinifera TaxID=29760 RepID=A0A438K3L6_VITVI|nr:NAD kinase 2, chloroplastic [Vitis vinifera]